MGGFAIGARVALLWQHNANPSYKLASISRYDDIVRTAGWAGSARAPKTSRRIREAGAAVPPPTGAFSTLLRQSGLRAFTAGVLATKSERKMLASTCLYSLYAWLTVSITITRGYLLAGFCPDQLGALSFPAVGPIGLEEGMGREDGKLGTGKGLDHSSIMGGIRLCRCNFKDTTV